jgi:hypothetical protein
MGFSTNDKLLRSLKGDSGDLEVLQEEFSKMLTDRAFRVCSFQENEGLKGFAGFRRKV